MADDPTPPDTPNESPATVPPPKGFRSVVEMLFDGILQWHKQLILVVGSAGLLATTVFVLLGQKEKAGGLTPSDWQFWLIVVVSGASLILTILFNILPELKKRRREWADTEQSVGLAKGGRAYFRLDPYEDADRAGFDRVDQAHRVALDKFRHCPLPYFYLVGVSGSGKSSVLVAYLIPELRTESVVVTRRGRPRYPSAGGAPEARRGLGKFHGREAHS